MAGTEETNPHAAAAVSRLRRWAVDPAAGGKIFLWNTEGDFERCVAFYKDRMPAHMVDGWCSNLHVLATGGRPGHGSAEVKPGAGAKH